MNFISDGCPSLECHSEYKLACETEEEKAVNDLSLCLRRKLSRDLVALERLEPCNKYNLSCVWPIPIVLQQVSSCIKQ